MTGRNSQISRIYRILDLMEAAPQGLTVGELCDRLIDRGHTVGKRTVYRDLQALTSAGFPLFEKGTDQVNSTRWTLQRSTRITDYLVLSTRELIALFLARSAMTPLKDTPFFEDLNMAFSKIEAKLGQGHRDFFSGLAAEFRFEAGPKWGLGVDADVVETLRAGCAERQVVSMNYTSVGKKSGHRKVGPHYLYFAKGALYLVAEDLESRVVKTFSVARMSKAELIDEAYEGVVSDPIQHFEGSFGVFRGVDVVPVKLQFFAPIAQYVKERQWHRSQKVNELNEGGVGAIEMSFELGVTPDLVQWVLGYGDKVEVLEPVELKEKVLKEARRVVERYAKKGMVA